MKKIVVAFFVCVLALSSCKKYPDGPSFSLLSKKERLSNSWVISKVLEDGVDKTGDYQTAYKNYNVIINKSGTYSLSYQVLGVVNYNENGNWTFNGDKTYVTLDPSSNNNSNFSLKILRLKETDLWLYDENNNGKKIEYHFTPK